MKKTIIIFIVFALIGFGGGYLFNQSTAPDLSATPDVNSSRTNDDESTKEASEEKSNGNESVETVSAEGQILQDKGCLACHAVGNLGLQGGVTGPDLSSSYVNVEGKHGKPMEEFLKEPTSAVMSTVISGSPLTDEEISKITEALKIASEK